jgi:hypothetical protein
MVKCTSIDLEVETTSQGKVYFRPIARMLLPPSLLLLLLQVTLLDPVRFPGAIKVFAREICRNDLLNFGRLHFFFPDSRYVAV